MERSWRWPPSLGSPSLAQGRVIWRFTGGGEVYERLFQTQPRLERHLSVFDESVALTEGLKWLLQLKFKEVEEEPEGALLEPLKKFINQPEFLPHHARLKDVTSRRVLFVDGTVWWEMKRQLRDIPELRALFRQAPEALGW